MPSVFTLFGELKADTKSFENSMRAAERDLKRVEREIDSTEKRANSLGKTSAVTARSFEKLRENVAKSRTQLTEAASAFQRGDITATKMGASLNRTANAAGNLNSRLKDTNAKLQDFAANGLSRLQSKLSAVGQGIQSFGRSMTVGVTAPLTALGYAAVRSAANLDSMMNRLRAATGSSEAATKRLKELRDMAQNNAGVFANAAVDLDAFFRPMKVGEQTINGLVKAFGRLQLADDLFDGKTFGRNLVQIFKTGDLQDVKEAIDRFPRFGEILAERFGIDGSSADSIKEGIKKLKTDTKLSLEDFLAGFSEAVQKDKNLGALDETISGRFAKAMERLTIALEPLGKVLVGALEAALPPIVSLLEDVSSVFESLPQPIQSVVVAFGALAAVAGPALIAVGAVASAAGSIAGVLSGVALAPLATALAAVAAVIAVVAAAVAALWVAWQTNFGNIRTEVEEVSKRISAVWSQVMNALSELTGAALAEMTRFWKDNGEDIKRAVAEVSKFIETTWRVQLAAVDSFWKEHGDTITTVAYAAWSAVREIVLGALTAITHAVAMAAAVINGDWSRFAQLYINLNTSIANGVIRVWNSLVDAMSDIGQQIIAGIIAGLHAQAANLLTTIAKIAGQVQTAFRNAMQIQSPSKVFHGYGEMIMAGLENGMRARIVPVVATAKEIADAVKEEFTNLGNSIKQLFLKGQGILGDFGKYFALRQQEADARAFTDALESTIQKALELGITLKSLADLDAFRNVQKLVNGVDALRGNAPALPDVSPLTASGTIGGNDLGGLEIGSIGDAGESAATAWDTFFTMFSTRLNEIKSSLPSFKESLTVNLLESAGRIGDIFANAVEQWDGTMQGFFRSIASGFAQLAKQIISELIRIAVMQAVLKLVGLFAGAAFGGGASAGPASGAAGSAGGAGHGLFGGLTQTLSAAGKGLASGLSGLAGGGLTPSFAGASSIMNDNRTNNNFTFNVSGGGQGIDARTRQQMISEFTSIIRQHEMRKK